MKISRLKKYNGFTIIELIVVVAGLATLAGISIPAYVDTIRLNKSEQVKAMMNSYIVDCFSEWRSKPDTGLDKLTPTELDGDTLKTLGYKLVGNKNKCDNVAITPIDEKQKNYGLEFSISEDGKIAKFGTPGDSTIKDNKFLNSCKGWAGAACSLTGDQKIEFERLAAIAKRKKECETRYNNWLGNGKSGQFVSWNKTKENCTKKVWAFEGLPVNSSEAVEEAQQAKYGKKCNEWRSDKRKRKVTTKGGISITKNPECGGVPYWYYSGREFTSEVEWKVHDNRIKKQKCDDNRNFAVKKKQGKVRIGPTPGPDPCGEVVYICKGSIHNSLAEYKTTSCGKPKPKPNPKPKPTPAYCKNFTPDKRCRPKFKGIPSFSPDSSQCKCPYP